MLTEELLAESPGIFNWALEGLDRLLERGHFQQPDVGGARRSATSKTSSSPVGAFVRDMCEIGPAHEVGKDELWEAWKTWCADEGQDKPGTKAVFTRDLRAAVPGLIPRRPREGDRRRQVYHGIKLRLQSRDTLTTPDRGRSGQGGQGWSGVA